MRYVLLSLICWMAIFLLDSVICPFYNWALFSNVSQMTSKCGENKTKQMAHEAQSSVLLKYLPHIEVFCDLFLYRPTATWNLFVFYWWWQSKSLLMARPSMHLFSNKSWTMSKNQSKYLHNSAYYIISNNAQNMYLLREVTLNFTYYQMWLRIEFFVSSLFTFVVGGVFLFFFFF